ncbi:uncharacterized protein K460DRAFT_210675 [Cucurbitaria berberidis CBS 394.84]|uniref:Uncharacterized protein n=1 Tax=Cucurbitaria berberidis CBS 394.84 TaxID=1168544 RepID=A0A9P4G7R7_9PLEO|nr:uncharacterized protein K460DRAFT_210675 [Cucurbitaria berberidis CBS 394.84]KAF1840554.1 hypothetical protein K460DRAFT_210675 [Cucurbitaria berberidis CBS 394.84]
MCKMISSKDVHGIWIEMNGGCLVDGLFLLYNLLFLSYYSTDVLLRLVEACSRVGISFPWPRMSMITIMSFLSYRDAIQLHVSYLRCSRLARFMCID